MLNHLNYLSDKSKKIKYGSLFLLILCTIFLSININSSLAQSKDKLVYVIPIENEVERGLEAFLVRSTDEAIEAGADHIVFEIDTPGGRVDSAGQIAKLLQGLEIDSTSYIVDRKSVV